MGARLVLPLSQLAEHLVREVNTANCSAIDAQTELRGAPPEFLGEHWDLPTLAVEECQFTLYLAPVPPVWIVRVWRWLLRMLGGSPSPSPNDCYELVPSAKAQIVARIRVVREGKRIKVAEIESEPPKSELATLKIRGVTN